MTTSQDLIEFVKKTLGNRKFVVAIQSEPYQHVRDADGEIVMQKMAGGAHVLLDGVLSQTGGLMVAIARGNADKQVADEKGRIEITEGEKNYTLKRIFLKKNEFNNFYFGFANQALWPLCHGVFVKPIFSKEWWDEYVEVNQKFADAIMEELQDEDAFIWINDYHLALLPRMLHEVRPSLAIGTFWHIPWPTQELFRICPWRKEIIKGLLGSDFISFHRDYHVSNFITCTRAELQVMVDTEPTSIKYEDHDTKLVNLPAGIDYEKISNTLSKYHSADKKIIKKDFGVNSEILAIGVERVDYTKGIPERFQIIDRFLEKYPEYIGKFTYISIAPLSRQQIPAYKSLQREMYDLADKINWRYALEDWEPIHIIDDTVPRDKLFAYFKVADIGMVTALDDGMNLVAKEYVISCKPDKGMLVLSKFTGAAKDLNKAVLINPYDLESSADALYEAITMSPDEKLKRNTLMKETLKENNIYKWAVKFIRNTIQWNEDEE